MIDPHGTQHDSRLSKLFDPKVAGQGLKEVKQELITQESEQLCERWFHGADDVDLFVWETAARQVMRQQITFAGLVVEWNLLDGTLTGWAQDSKKPMTGIKASQLIHYDEKPSAVLVETALEIIKNMTEIDETFRQLLLDSFTKVATHTFTGAQPRIADTRKRTHLSKFEKFLQWLVGR